MRGSSKPGVIAVSQDMDCDLSFKVKRVEWSDAKDRLRAVRYQVFVVEQRVREEEEWDAFDAQSMHVLAVANDGRAIGTGRLLPDAHIGRMAVLSCWRGRGVGSALLVELIRAARDRGDHRVVLNAQAHAVRFYEKHGFRRFGEEFLEVGIAHWAMELMLR